MKKEINYSEFMRTAIQNASLKLKNERQRVATFKGFENGKAIYEPGQCTWTWGSCLSFEMKELYRTCNVVRTLSIAAALRDEMERSEFDREFQERMEFSTHLRYMTD